MTSDKIQSELKRLSTQMQERKDPDGILVMEAMCELEDLNTKFKDVSNKYAALLKDYRELSQTLIDSGNEGLLGSSNWNDPSWQVGYIQGVQDCVNIVNRRISE